MGVHLEVDQDEIRAHRLQKLGKLSDTECRHPLPEPRASPRRKPLAQGSRFGEARPAEGIVRDDGEWDMRGCHQGFIRRRARRGDVMPPGSQAYRELDTGVEVTDQRAVDQEYSCDGAVLSFLAGSAQLRGRRWNWPEN